MQKLDDDFTKLIDDAVAGDDKAFRQMYDAIESDMRVWDQRDLLLEALPINNESNSNARTLRALILLMDVPGRTLFQSQEGAILMQQAVVAGNPVAMLNKAIYLLLEENPVLKYEGINLFRQLAEREEPLALSVGIKMFGADNVATFAQLITQLDALQDVNPPSAFQP